MNKQPISVTLAADNLLWLRGQAYAAGARAFFADLFSNPAYQPVDLTPDQVYLADEARPNGIRSMRSSAPQHATCPCLCSRGTRVSRTHDCGN